MQIQFDCTDPAKLAGFWSAALDYEIVLVKEDGERAVLADPQGVSPRLVLRRVPEPKTVKNRLHFDVLVSPLGSPPVEAKPFVDAEAERLRAMGAIELRVMSKPNDYFIVMTDPEGNEFCIA